jgi:hypothetical protein
MTVGGGELQPPTYVEAMENSLRLECEEAKANGSSSSRSSSHVVQIEIRDESRSFFSASNDLNCAAKHTAVH